MSQEFLTELMRQVNEVLTAATVIVAVSMLLYHLTHGPRDRVARASSVLLGCVTVIYMGDVLVTINKAPTIIEQWLRLEWIGIAFAPAALFHLSDALLATTGIISRGRRRRVVRLLYTIASLFLFMALGTDLLIGSLLTTPLPMMKAGSLLWLYMLYFGLATVFSFNNVLRARRRCLTRATHRRMSYLLIALPTPVLGIFPYSLLFAEPAQVNPFWSYFLINLGNLAIVLMLIFMSYPLSFFGPKKPDRVIKAELLSFMLRGPVTGIAVLVVTVFFPRLSTLGLPGLEVMPFAAVTIVLALQWSFTVIIPFLEERLIFTRDQDQSATVREMAEHLLTESDARQMLEANLAAICDYLRVSSAFAASFSQEGSRIEQSVGPLLPVAEQLDSSELSVLLTDANRNTNGGPPTDLTMKVVPWQQFWLLPLRSSRGNGRNGRLVGVVGIWARSLAVDLLGDEEKVLKVLSGRIGRVIDDMLLQQELFARLEDVIEESSVSRVVSETNTWDVSQVALEAREETEADMLDQTDLTNLIKNALRDFWGGPRLTEDRLVHLSIVEQALPENEGNPAKAVRAVLHKAIERLKPDGQRSLTLPEWTIYNILDLRFVQGKKVREVVRPLVLTEPDFYRKQKMAIDRVVQEIIEMERRARQQTGQTVGLPTS